MTFLNSKDDCQWLKETHLKHHKYLPFKSFILHGNEDAPDKIELFVKYMPKVTDVPIQVINPYAE